MATKSTTYKSAGVDITAADNFIDEIIPEIKKTESSDVLSSIGHYAGHYLINKQKYPDPVIVSSTDGVGTKLKLAFEMKRFDTVGIDLVAMSVNDILCSGADPLFFLDYFATGKLNIGDAKTVIKGIIKGCLEAGCTLLGGETAEMPGFYKNGEFDLAGFAVGVVNRDKIIDGSNISIGNKIIGLASSGVHSNGYSLVRKIIKDKNLDISATYPDLTETLGETLLKPTRIYVNTIARLKRDFPVLGIAHITGGGLIENPPRILPQTCKAILRKESWPLPPIFKNLKSWGNIDEEEMRRVFNCGIGLMIVVSDKDANEILTRLPGLGEAGWIIGEIVKRNSDESQLEIL